MPNYFTTTKRNIEYRKGVNNGFFDNRVSNPTNDIVFTKSDVVEKVLDVVEMQDPDAFNSITKKYCDIGCKSGAYLCGIADRIFNSPVAIESFPDEIMRWRHIFKYQIFGVASDALLQRGTQMRVYGIFDEDGDDIFADCWCNIISTDILDDPSQFNPKDIMKRFNKIDNFTTIEIPKKYGEREIKKMAFEKFDYIIGNPPYQIDNGNNTNIWHKFIEKGIMISDKACMIHPGRWVVATQNWIKTRDTILDSGLAYFDYYPISSEIFEGTNFGGGITITYFDKEKENTTYSIRGKFRGNYNKNTKFFENMFEEEAFTKITVGVESFIKDRVFDFSAVCDISSNRGFLKSSPDECKYPIKIWANAKGGLGSRKSWNYIDRERVDGNVYNEATKSKKIMISKTGNGVGAGGTIFDNKAEVVEKESVGVDVFFVYPENDEDIDILKSYFETKTVRFLMSITQKDYHVKGFENVPDYTYFIDELNGELFTDEFFYNKYNFSPELIKYIEANIAEK